MATNPFTAIRAKAGDTDRSVQWYQAQIKTLGRISSQNLMSTRSALTNSVKPGNLYMFFYDAKHQDTLPYWDRFPLALPFSQAKGGFLGINLHYLTYPMRFKILGALHQFANEEKITEKTKLNLSWSLLSRMSSIGPVKKCVKHYLTEHVESRFLKINYPDWVTASMLPVEQFVGASKTKVWQLTRDTNA